MSAAGDDRGRLCGETVATVIDALARVMAVNEEELGRIDAVAGDGDHGRGMVRGTEYATLAAQAAAAQGAGPQGVLTAAGEAWAAKAGGTSGVLWGAALTAMGTRLGDKGQPGAHDLADGVRAGYDAIVALGGAKLGDKTMLDALWPFVETLSAAVGNGVLTAQAWDESRRRCPDRSRRHGAIAPAGGSGTTAGRTERRDPGRRRDIHGDVCPYRRCIS